MGGCRLGPPVYTAWPHTTMACVAVAHSTAGGCMLPVCSGVLLANGMRREDERPAEQERKRMGNGELRSCSQQTFTRVKNIFIRKIWIRGGCFKRCKQVG